MTPDKNQASKGTKTKEVMGHADSNGFKVTGPLASSRLEDWPEHSTATC